ncbi:hypothetical protein CDAR_181841 [Caerostris darwini]|uniref:Uncharacterized protein n=1 Tax=Caerostris darwini TaxID=1538125 RepID=A0AAV4UG45_9ARAC|nr:hypothetical protein CDAR_181841 [Caerostris darwini]
MMLKKAEYARLNQKLTEQRMGKRGRLVIRLCSQVDYEVICDIRYLCSNTNMMLKEGGIRTIKSETGPGNEWVNVVD